MAQTLIAHYNFNDNDNTLVHDFSVNEWHSTSETGLTISTDSGATGKVGVFNGTTTTLNFGNITDFNSITGFSAVFKVNFSSFWGSGTALFASVQNLFEIQFSTAGVPIFYFYDSTSSAHNLTASDPLDLNTWYTIVITWDGENINYYNGSSDVLDTAGAADPSFDTSGSDFKLMDSARLACKVEVVSFYSKALSTDEIDTIMENPSGIQYEAGDGMIQTGDLIYNNSGGKEVCTWTEEFDEMEFSDNEEQLFADGELQIFKN